MATIDERAEEFGKQGCGENCIFICEEWKDKNGVCSRLASRAALYKSIATEQRAIDIDKFKSKLKSILIIAQDPTMHQERKEMEILAMIQNSLEE